MNRFKPKKYHRPFMIVESFVPNEFVAGCVNSDVSEASGIFCFDLNGNGKFDWGPRNERGYLSNPLGNYAGLFSLGKYKIEEQGRYIYEEGGKTYLFVGTNFDDSGLSGVEYSYSELFLPIYYAKLSFEEPNHPGVFHYHYYYYTGSDGKGFSNAS